MSAARTDRKAAWKKAKRHKITLQSGFEVEIEIPNLAAMLKAGDIPNDLVDAAIATASGTSTPSKEALIQQGDFERKLVTIAVKDPEIAEEDVDDIPYEDVELIVSIATRNRDVDAIGNHIGGLHEKEEWRTFRGV